MGNLGKQEQRVNLRFLILLLCYDTCFLSYAKVKHSIEPIRDRPESNFKNKNI